MSYPRYPKYKDSGVEWLGEVPEHWEVMALKRIVEVPITDGPHETPEFLDDGIPFVSAEAVASGRIDFEKIRGFIAEVDHARYSVKYRPKLHDIYMVKSGATTGVTAIVETDAEFNIWSPLAAIRCGEIAVPYFIVNFLRSRNFQEAVTLNWSFGTQQNIGMGVLQNLSIALPPVDEQTAIATFLDRETSRIDTLISEKERLIILLQEYRQALISHAVTKGLDSNVKMKDSGVEWLGEVPEYWNVKRLKHIADIRLSNVDKHTVEGQKGVKLCNYLDVYNNRHITSKIDFMAATASDEQIKRLSVLKNDVIITKDSEDPKDIGIPAFVSEDIFGLVCGYHLAILRPTISDGEFLHYLLQGTLIRALFEVEATGMTRYALGKHSIENLPPTVPPLSEQQAIASFLNQETTRIDTLISEARKFIDLLKEYRSSLITAAVTGKIDVRELVSLGSEQREIPYE